jgi:hypothetical protein
MPEQVPSERPKPRHNMAIAPRCTAMAVTTGKRCNQAAIRGGRVCIVHGGGSPAAKAAAQMRIAMLVDPALEVMFELLISKKTHDSVRFNVAKDIMDRAGFKPVDKFQEIPWDGDPSKLDDQQLETLRDHLIRLAYGEDRARIEAAKRKALEGNVIETTAVSEPTPEPTEEW